MSSPNEKCLRDRCTKKNYFPKLKNMKCSCYDSNQETFRASPKFKDNLFLNHKIIFFFSQIKRIFMIYTTIAELEIVS